MNKWKALLASRKFWFSLVGIAVSSGLLEFSESQQAELVQAIMVIVGAIGYVFSIAVEDGMTKVAEAQRTAKTLEAITTYNERRAERQAQARKERMAR